MSVIQSIFANEIEDALAKMANGLSHSLVGCENLANEDVIVLFGLLSNAKIESTIPSAYDGDDEIFSRLLQSLLHALIHEKEREGNSAFDLISKCILICLECSIKCKEVLNSFLMRNLQSHIKTLKEGEFSAQEDVDEDLNKDCPKRMRIPIESVFHLLFELSKYDTSRFSLQGEKNGKNMQIFLLRNDEIFASLLQFLTFSTADGTLAILSQIIRMYLRCNISKKKVLFEKILEVNCHKSEGAVMYGITCLLIDEFLCGTEYDIRNEEILVAFIQNGLTDDDLLTRKRSMYILKRIVHASCKDAGQWSKLDDFILLYETLEEKQLHVMLPMFPKIDNIKELSNHQIHGKVALNFSWLTAVLIRALNHDNRFITKWAVEIILHLKVDDYQFFEDEKWFYIAKPLFDAFREFFLFEKETGVAASNPPIVVKLLTQFLMQCRNAASSKILQIEFFRKVLEFLCSNGYNAMTFPYIADAISSFEIAGIVDSNLLTLMKKWMLSETSTFPAELKLASFHLILQIAIQGIGEITLAEFIKFLKIIFEQDCLIFGGEIWCQFIQKMTDKIFHWKATSLSKDFLKNLEALHAVCHSAVTKYVDGNCVEFETAEEIVLVMLIAIDITIGDGEEAANKLIERFLNPVFEVLVKFGRYPYIDEDKVTRSVNLTKLIFKTCINSRRSLPMDHVSFRILNILLGMTKNIFHMIQAVMQLSCDENAFNKDLITSSFNLQFMFCGHVRNDSALGLSHGHLLMEQFHFIIKFCLNRFENKHQNRNLNHLYIILKSLEMLCNFLNGKEEEFTKIISKQFESSLLDIIKNICIDFSSLLPIDYSNYKRKQECSRAPGFEIGEVLNTLWSLVSFALKNVELRSDIANRPSFEKRDSLSLPMTLSTCNLNDVVQKILDTIDISVGNDMIPLLQCLEHLMQDIVASTLDLSLIVLKSIWRLLKEQERRDSRFWKVFTPCVNILFHKSLLLSREKDLLDQVSEFWRFLEDVGKKKSGLFNVVVSHCCSIWEAWIKEESCGGVIDQVVAVKKHNLLQSMMWCFDMIVDACTFGHVQKKASRIMQQVIRYFDARYDREVQASKNVNVDYQARWIVMKMLLQLNGTRECSLIVTEVMKRLVAKDRKISLQMKRYYDNSMTHRQKLRIWQTMLVLVKFINEKNAEELMSEALSVMVSENQPSIRYYIEWFIVILINQLPSLKVVIWQKLKEASERRVCSVTCLMSIVMHVAVVLPDKDFSEMATEAFTKILPWVQIHHMQARVHAQIVIWRLWDEVKKRGCDELIAEFRIIDSLFTLNESNSSVFRARKELRNHFYFKYFHPIDHFSLETIFCSMPKLLNIGDDEILERKDLVKMVGDSADFYGVPVFNQGISLFDLVTAEGRMSFGDDSKSDERESSSIYAQQGHDNRNSGKGSTDVQKKIVAWKPLPPTEDPFLQKADIYKTQMRRSKLVLCASLIDRTPNLGGLCRTCEIFGVSTMVIGAMRYLDDSNFKSLSVTAEKWMNVEQVLPRHLEVYLNEMKSKGYRLVGIEQTANSKSLQDYKFQEKTLLFLGNEREGIPVELIQLLDDCVEIPQQGVIRSLNVHVSGAITIWEYCRQQLLAER